MESPSPPVYGRGRIERRETKELINVRVTVRSIERRAEFRVDNEIAGERKPGVPYVVGHQIYPLWLAKNADEQQNCSR
jgi:hypothetical protein